MSFIITAPWATGGNNQTRAGRQLGFLTAKDSEASGKGRDRREGPGQDRVALALPSLVSASMWPQAHGFLSGNNLF